MNIGDHVRIKSGQYFSQSSNENLGNIIKINDIFAIVDMDEYDDCDDGNRIPVDLQDLETMKWTLHIGIHRGTITSRDSENPKQFDSLEECREHATDAFRWYRSMGCQCWFCYAISPTGERTTLIQGEDYN